VKGVPVVGAKPDDVRELLRKGSLFLADFWAAWCAPCVAMEPYLRELAARLEKHGVPVLRLDVDDEETREYALANGVTSVPTVVLFAGGREEMRVVGFDPEELARLVERIRELLSPRRAADAASSSLQK
jgi:Thiol-disulfide isomerase and thioredoxins